MIIKQIHSMTEVKSIDWNNLVQNKDPFICHEFLLALEQSGAVCANTGWLPHHLLVYEQKQLIAAMPLYLKNHSRGEYIFDQQWANAYFQSGMAYYPKWVNAVPFTPCQGQRILILPGIDNSHVIQKTIETAQQLAEKQHISGLHCLFPPASQIDYLQTQMLIREDIQFQWFNKKYRSFDDYLQTFTSRQRKNTNKERRKINEQGISLQRLSGLEISQQQWQVFFSFYEMTYLKRGQSAYLSIDFFKQLSTTMPEKMLLVLASKAQSYIGAALSFIGEDTLYGRYWGCFEEYSQLHFEACYYQGLEYCIEKNIQRFDSGAQGEHKISRGFEPVTTYSAHWIQNPYFAKLIENFLQREQPLIQQYKHNCSQRLPFKRNN